MLFIIIVILLAVGVILPALIIGFVLTKDGIARQKRISRMKHFRKSVRPPHAGFTDEDRRTIA